MILPGEPRLQRCLSCSVSSRRSLQAWGGFIPLRCFSVFPWFTLIGAFKLNNIFGMLHVFRSCLVPTLIPVQLVHLVNLQVELVILMQDLFWALGNHCSRSAKLLPIVLLQALMLFEPYLVVKV